MTERYDPPAAKIDDLLARFTPRQLAIGYLRAQRRARSAETAFDVLGNVTDLQRAALTGDMKGAQSAVDAARRRMRSHKEHSE